MTAKTDSAEWVEPTGPLYGYLVEFDSPQTLVAAAATVRDAGYTRWDCHTPFPVRGLDEAMAIRRTRLPWLALGAGMVGLGLGVWLPWYLNAVDYPFLTSGKPPFSLPAFIPIAFALAVLFAAAAAVLGMLVASNLPQWYHPLFSKQRFLRVTTDGFFLSVEARDPRFDEAGTRAFLDSLGGIAVEPVRSEADAGPIPSEIQEG